MTRRARAGRAPVAARRGRSRLLRLAALPGRDVGRARRPRLERRRAAPDHRQRGSRTAASRRRRGALALGARFDPAHAICGSSRAARRAPSARPGPTAFGRPDLDASFDRDELVVSALLRRRRRDRLAQLSLGYALTDQLSLDPLDSGCFVPEWEASRAPTRTRDFPNPAGFQNDTTAWWARLSGGRRRRVAAPADGGRRAGARDGRPRQPRARRCCVPSARTSASTLQDRVLVGSRAYLTLGGRVERNDSYGTHAVPRAALAVRLRDGADATTLRASAGAGIKEPSFFESFGVSFFAHGNPDLDARAQPHLRRGRRAAAARRAACARRPRTSITTTCDQIAYTIVDFTHLPGQLREPRRTRARSGLELALEARPVAALRASSASTRYLRRRDPRAAPSDFDPVYAVGQPLLRRPKHQASLSAQWQRARAGAPGVTLVLRRQARATATSSASASRRPSNAAYTRLDARVRARDRRTARGVRASPRTCSTRSTRRCSAIPALGRTVRAGLAAPARRRTPVSGVRSACCSPGAAARTARSPSTCCASAATSRSWAC